MSLHRRTLLAALACTLVLPAMTRTAVEFELTPKGLMLSGLLDSLDVESKWLAGQHIDWKTGEPDGRPVGTKGLHTHCSAFVAAAAQRLGVYILRPPEHGQVLLANAQNEWLGSQGLEAGWRRLGSVEDAQEAANRGWLVVASYHNHYDDRPGHIVIVRPGQTTSARLAAEGPDVIQAATVNSRSISLKAAFAGHRTAWRDHEIDLYAHPVSWPPP